MKRCLPILITLAACGGGFDAKSAAEGNRIGPETEPRTSPTSPPPRAIALGERFAVHAIAFDVDVFETAPAGTFPFDAHGEVGTIMGDFASGEGGKRIPFSGHTYSVTFPRPMDEFDGEVAPVVAAGTRLGSGLTLGWDRVKNVYHAFVLRAPPILGAADVASAEVTRREHVSINLNSNATETTVTSAITVRVTAAGSAKYAAWQAEHLGHPIAYATRGHVMREDHAPPTLTEVIVELGWLEPEQTPAAAKAFVDAISAGKAVK